MVGYLCRIATGVTQSVATQIPIESEGEGMLTKLFRDANAKICTPFILLHIADVLNIVFREKAPACIP